MRVRQYSFQWRLSRCFLAATHSPWARFHYCSWTVWSCCLSVAVALLDSSFSVCCPAVICFRSGPNLQQMLIPPNQCSDTVCCASSSSRDVEDNFYDRTEGVQRQKHHAEPEALDAATLLGQKVGWAVLCCAVVCRAVLCCAAPCCAALRCAVLCCAVLS